ncbi:MAG: PilN domain-containing protein [Candidatus Omnitrophica bacterium]|nr:PilN domain-containing protein [Candidatus Omnitrophota bacterium]
MRTRVVIEVLEGWLKVSVGRKVAVAPLANLEPGSISSALNLILKQNKCGKDLEVSVVLSRNKITVRRVDLPSQDPAEIEQMLGLYLIRQIPYHKEEVSWAYQNLGFDGVSNSHLILAVALKNVFKNIVSSFVPVNILPESILMSSQGLVHYVVDACRNKIALPGSYMILDIDVNYSDLVLVHNHKLGSSVVIPQGAEQLKELPEKEKFAAEFKQALVALNNEIPEARCERLFLTGAASSHLGFVESISAKDFNLKAQYLSSKEYDNFLACGFGGVSLSAILGFSAQAAKDDLKFILPEIQIKKDMKFKLQQLMILGVGLIYILIMLGGGALVRLVQQQSYAADLKNRVVSLGKDAKGLEDIISKLKIARQYTDVKSSALTYLNGLNRLCPDNIVITNYNWELGKAFTIRGYAQAIPDILDFTNTLGNSETFKGAQNRYTRRRKLKDNDVVDFEIFVK